MPVISARRIKSDERSKFCHLLGQMLDDGISTETKRRLSLEFERMVGGFKSFQDIETNYGVKVEQKISDDGFMHLFIHVPKEYIPNGYTGVEHLDFIVNVSNSNSGGVGPVLSKEEADKIYSTDGENTFGVQ